jgi:hypothetical protein
MEKDKDKDDEPKQEQSLIDYWVSLGAKRTTPKEPTMRERLLAHGLVAPAPYSQNTTGGPVKSLTKFALLATASILVSGCSNSYTFPLAVVMKEVPGGIMRGEVHGTREGGGTFSASGGKLTCAGDWGGNMSPTIVIPVLCNDGRKGVVTATRTGTGGGGRFTLNDGSTGDFIYGEGAQRF